MTADIATLAKLLQEHRPSPEQPANILRTLLSVQQVFGSVSPETIRPIAEALRVTEAEVAGVLSYYPDLHTKPHGRRVIRLCLGEACVANRAHRVLAELREGCAIDLGETSADGRFTLERVYCLGNCAVGPTVMVDDRIYGRVTGAELRKILELSAVSEQGKELRADG